MLGLRIFCLVMGIPCILNAATFFWFGMKANSLSQVALPIVLYGGYGIGVIIFGFTKKEKKES